MPAWAAVALVYATQWLAGELAVRALWRGVALLTSERLARALLLGPAAIAAQMALVSMAGLRLSLPLVLAPWWVAALALLLRRGRRPAAARARSVVGAGVRGQPTTGDTAPLRSAAGAVARGRRLHGAAVALALALAAALAWLGLRTPVFDSDPLNNFALPARVFAAHRGLAPEVLAGLRAVGHAEYPPLLALNEALVLMAAEAGASRPEEALPLGLRAVMPFFALAWLALQLLVAGEAFRRIRASTALPLALFAMLIPELFAQGTVGLAELRLAACVLLLGIEGRELLLRPGAGAALRAAAAAAACALTKNEGIAIAALAALPLAALVARRRVPARAGLAALAVVAVACAGWVAWLAAHGVPGGYWSSGSLATMRIEGERFAAVLAGFTRYFGLGQGWSAHFGVLWPAAALAGVVGLAASRVRREAAVLLAVLAAHLALYVAALALLPQHVEWSLQVTGLRLVFHVMGWPLLLLIAATGALAPAPLAPAPAAAAPVAAAGRDAGRDEGR